VIVGGLGRRGAGALLTAVLSVTIAVALAACTAPPAPAPAPPPPTAAPRPTEVVVAVDDIGPGFNPHLLAHQSPEYQEAYLKTAKLVAITPRTNTDAKLLRRQLEEVRKTGYWLSTGESVPGSAAVAAPVFGPDGQILAALSLGAPSDRMEAYLNRFRTAIVAAAARASGLNAE